MAHRDRILMEMGAARLARARDGGGPGVGRAIVLRLADEGVDVAICGRRARPEVLGELQGGTDEDLAALDEP